MSQFFGHTAHWYKIPYFEIHWSLIRTVLKGQRLSVGGESGAMNPTRQQQEAQTRQAEHSLDYQ
ncbi:hypothetical protein E2C01_014000 [Portunus trituberculatus]|uniref:Uncharacterized protein n=1 Tax=Portunus trituberculatus TaxID=210409 RepID=A0A5B7DI09_PORTR|nr:hypothetical protein [Portunus trituberculatus]